MPSLAPIPFYYLRHGQTDWNLEKRAMGQADIPLNSRGIAQAISARDLLAGANIQTICYSPLQRAKQTAELFQELLHCDLVCIEELREFNLGPHSGKLFGKWFEDWRLGKELAGAEAYPDFLTRCINGINKALEHPGPVLIVAHGGVYWAVEHAIQLKQEDHLPNCIPLFHQPPQQEQHAWSVIFKEP